MNRGEKVFDDEIRYVAAQPLAGGEVSAEMLPPEDAAQRRFFGGGGDTCEGAFDSRENLGSHVELGVVPLEKGNQHLRPGSAYYCVSSWIGWVGCGLADFR